MVPQHTDGTATVDHAEREDLPEALPLVTIRNMHRDEVAYWTNSGARLGERYAVTLSTLLFVLRTILCVHSNS